jgi:putative ABC transport system permease protein
VGGWTVVLRGIRYRSGRSLMVLLLASIATAATILAPAYARAAQQSVLSDRLADAPVNATGLHLSTDPLAGDGPESTVEAKLAVQQLLNQDPTLRRLLGTPVGSADQQVTTVPAGAAAEPVQVRLAYRDNICAHVTMTKGECTDEAGGVMVSERSAAAEGLTMGGKLTVRARAGSLPRSLSIVGFYTPKDATDPYWGRGGYFTAGPNAGSPGTNTSAATGRIDAAFVADEVELAVPSAPVTVQIDYRLNTGQVRLDDLASLRQNLTSFTTAANARRLEVESALRGVLDDIDVETAALGRTVPVVAVPLILVCWFVVFLMVAAVTEERTPEVALAKLRGFSSRRSGRFGRGETMLLVLAAVPIGVLIGLGAVEVAARTLLAPGVHVQPGMPILIAALIAAVLAYLTVRMASARPLARPVLSLLRRVPERTRWKAGAADGAVIALAAASFAVAVNDPTAPVALLAPALIALVAGVLTARALGLWSRIRVRRHARKGRVTGVLAHAQLSRRTLGQRVMLIVTVSVALLGFAATAWDVAAKARADVATDSVGADRVLLVGAADPHALVSAVAAAGSGQAIAVVRATERYAGSTVEVVGVSSQHLADVAVWRGHPTGDLAQLTTRLHPSGDVPAAIPAALAGASPSDDPEAAQFTFPGLGENAQRFTVVSRSSYLPRVGSRAILFDLDYGVRAAEKGAGLSDNTRLRYEVWASPSAPLDLATRLADQGLQILGTSSVASVQQRLSRAAPALGLDLYLLAGGAAVLLAVGTVLLTAYVGSGTRRYELAALNVAGVRRRTLRAGLLREYVHLLGLPFVVGLLAGGAGALLMLPAIPLVTVGTATGAITYTPSRGALPIAVAATAIGLFVAVLSVLRLVRSARPERLREGAFV